MRYFEEITPNVKINLMHFGKKELPAYTITGRVIYKRQKIELSLQMKASPDEWDFEKEMFYPTKNYNIHCNQKIGEFKLAVQKAFEELKKGSIAPSVKGIKELLTGKKMKNSEIAFIQYYDQVVEQKKQQTTIYRPSSIQQYFRARTHLFNFLIKMGWTNIQLGELSRSFIIEFEHYLLSNKLKAIDKPMMRSSAVTNIKRIKAVVNEAVKSELLDRNPFEGYQVQHEKVQNISYLTAEQLKKILDLDVTEYRALVRTKDYFHFLCQCGLRYGDFQNLHCNDLEYSADGLLWLSMEQQKTRGMLNFPLTPIAKEIILKYQGTKSGNSYVFERLSNQIMNKHLRTLKIMAGLKSKVSCHTGRHTFAVNTIDKGIALEVVQRLLGHKSISSTQIYAQISNKKLTDYIHLMV